MGDFKPIMTKKKKNQPSLLTDKRSTEKKLRENEVKV